MLLGLSSLVESLCKGDVNNEVNCEIMRHKEKEVKAAREWAWLVS